MRKCIKMTVTFRIEEEEEVIENLPVTVASVELSSENSKLKELQSGSVHSTRCDQYENSDDYL